MGGGGGGSDGEEEEEEEVVGRLELLNAASSPLQQCEMMEKRLLNRRTVGGASPSRPHYSLCRLVYLVLRFLPSPT